jgi:hypothetical protein
MFILVHIQTFNFEIVYSLIIDQHYYLKIQTLLLNVIHSECKLPFGSAMDVFSSYANVLTIVLKVEGHLRKGLVPFLGTFAKLRKATYCFVNYVCPSTWKNPAPTGRIFMKFDILIIFRKSA